MCEQKEKKLAQKLSVNSKKMEQKIHDPRDLRFQANIVKRWRYQCVLQFILGISYFFYENGRRDLGWAEHVHEP